MTGGYLAPLQGHQMWTAPLERRVVTDEGRRSTPVVYVPLRKTTKRRLPRWAGLFARSRETEAAETALTAADAVVFYLSDARAGDAASQTVVRSIPVRTESARMAFLSAVRHRKALRRCQRRASAGAARAVETS